MARKAHRDRGAFACGVLLCAALLYATGGVAAENRKPRPAQIKAVTYNLYVGADIFRVFDPPVCGVPQAVRNVYDIVEATDFAARAEAIADQIEAVEPHVVGLQEVALIRTQFPGNALAPDGSGVEFLGDFPADPSFVFRADATDVAWDYLQLLLDALSARGLEYVAVDDATSVNADIEFPAVEFDPTCTPLAAPLDVRLTDRDVILVRADLAVNAAAAGHFQVNAPIELQAVLPTPGGPVPAIYVNELTRGWGAVNVTIKDQAYSVVNTHLEVGDRSALPDQGLNVVQAAQALELAELSAMLPTPLLLLGDINSSPASGLTDPRLAYAILTSGDGAALVDIWTAQDKPPDDGATCCQPEFLDNSISWLTERIDVVLADFGELEPKHIRAEVLGDEPVDATPTGLWPSDHAGVGARIQFERD